MKFIICHRKPERSFFFRGKQFPMCARCTGIIIGYLAIPLFLIRLIGISLPMALCFQLPAIVDGSLQYLTRWESNNPLRLGTGILFGVGQIALISLLGTWLSQQLLLFFCF